MRRLSFLLFLAACKNSSPAGGPDAMVDAAPQCTAPDNTACAGKLTPICGDDHTCRFCKAHAECDSHACLPNGSCGSDSNVAYVSRFGTDNADCTLKQPCHTVATALETGKTFVKMTGVTSENVTTIARNVTFLADPGAKLVGLSAGPVLMIGSNSKVVVYDLEITGGIGATGDGVEIIGNTSSLSLLRAKVTSNSNTGAVVASLGILNISETMISYNGNFGVESNNGTLNIARSTILSNRQGGMRVINGESRIIGNIIADNGNNQSTIGGIDMTTGSMKEDRVDFNTFAFNTAQDGIGSALHCLGPMKASNNIISNNRTTTTFLQVTGTCTYSYSVVNGGDLPTGAGNLARDPLFVDIANQDFHVQSTSPARRAADPAADLTGLAALDIDGDLRVVPASIGADQVK